MLSIYKYLLVFVFGASGYGALEIAYRGRTHWTMLLTGGICFVFVYMIAQAERLRNWQKWLLGGTVITVVEFIVGLIVNIGLGWKVWSYANMPINIMGQVCPLFSLMWCFLCIPLMSLCSLVEREISR